MLRTSVPFALLLLAAAPAAAQGPDDFFSDRTQVYLRWDGTSAHGDAFQKTVLGQMMQGDTGRLCDALIAQLDAIPVPPDQREQAAALKRLGQTVLRHGAVVGVEVFGAAPPDARLTVVLPQAAEELPAVQKLIGMAVSQGPVKASVETVDGKRIQHIAFPGGHFFTFAAGPHAVAVVGTADPERYFAALKTKEPLGRSALYKAARGDGSFPTCAYGFVDVAALLELARGAAPPQAGEVFDTLGLTGLKAVRFRGGYDGRATRTQLEFQLKAGVPRMGLLRLLGGKSLTLADLPALPDDLLGFSAGSFDLADLYDTLLQTMESIAKLAPPGQVPPLREQFKMADDYLGVSIRDDLLGPLAGRYLHYASPGESFFGSGNVVALQVKDPARLTRALQTAITNAARKNNAPVKLATHQYHGVTFTEVTVGVPGFFLAPTYAVHNGWLVVGLFPQPVQGFVLRQSGALPAWKPPADLRESLGRLPKEFTAVSVSDPRPVVRTLLALAPPLAAAARSAVPELQGFDVGLIPNGHEATKPLFPNVTVATDDGEVVRVDSLDSLMLPFPLALLGESPASASFLMFAAVGMWTARAPASPSFERAVPQTEPRPARPADNPKPLDRPPDAPKPPPPEKPPLAKPRPPGVG